MPISPVAEFLDDNLPKATLLIAFLANAKLARVSHNKYFTRTRIGLRHGKTVVRIEVDTDCPSADPCGRMVRKLMQRFGLSAGWASLKRSVRDAEWRMQHEMEREIASRGGHAGLEKIRGAALDLGRSKSLKAKRKAAVVRGEVARALAAVRRARKAGATVRQLNKIVRTVLAEEAVEEVQNN